MDQQNVQLCYKDTDSLIIHIKTKEVYEDIISDVEKILDTSSWWSMVDRPLPIGKNKKVAGLMKGKLGGQIIAFRRKAYSYKMDDSNSDKKGKVAKICVIKEIFKFNGYKNAH